MVSENTSLDERKVLVVEDAQDTQDFITHVLSQAGAKLVVASDGDEGIQKALSESPDIVLLDLEMPTSGFAVIRELRAKNYTKPILAITAHDSIEIRDRCHEAGFDGYIAKPLNSEKLVSIVSEHISNSR